MTYKYFKKFFKYFKEEKIPFFIYATLSLIAALLELCGVVLIYPFILKILSDKQNLIFGMSPLFLGIIIVVIFLLKNVFMIVYTYIQAKYTTNFGMKIKKIFMNYFLRASYQETSTISLAQKMKILDLLVTNITNGFIFRLLNLSVNFFIFLFILLCLAVKFTFATLSAVLFGIFMLIVQHKIYKPLIEKFAKKISESTLLLNSATNEALLNIKAVKISNNEKYFYENYKQRLKSYCENNMKNSFILSIPPYVTEPFAILLLFVMVAVIASQTYTEPTRLVASLALIGTAIFRITPSIARIQVNINGLNAALPMVKEFLEIYEKFGINNDSEIIAKDFAEFNNSIELKNVNFAYIEGKLVLNHVNLKINKGEFVGISGKSGVGKTTLIDIIAGLYKPNSGEILIDGKSQDKPLKIGYVPQEFILIKGSIRENVAFGNPIISDKKVIESLKQAQLYDYIVKTYKDGIYATPFVDSTGLSQGQKQRLAIARVLYSEPDILILDEATSALDGNTEKEICKVLDELKGRTTIIVIAHRLSTIENADKIINLE